MKWFCKAVRGSTKDPGNKMYRRLANFFLTLEEIMVKEDLVRLDLSAEPQWVKDLAKDTLTWAQDLYKSGAFPRDDYKEFLSWVIFHLGGEVPGFWPLNMPGADNNARWMSDCIYNCKAVSCSKWFPMTRKEQYETMEVTKFSVLFYARPWFEGTLAALAPRSDLTFACHMLRYYKMSRVWDVMRTWYRQMWYLTGQLVPLAPADKELSSSEREGLARVLHATVRDQLRVGKPVFPVVNFFLTPTPTAPSLSEFVTSDSWTIFVRLGIDGANVSLNLN